MKTMFDKITKAAETVHEHLGSGHSESVYHRSMERELSERGIPFSSENTIPILYKGTTVGTRRPDMFVTTDDEQIIIIELKSGSKSGEEQLLDYQDIVSDDQNFEIAFGMLIQFNEEIEVLRS